ncbi:hypothetical protein [Dysgonomonas massiliensis]|uniref:hypothetical protein n=1 Tax=Dysgonomonas massiliensis TaxID=2040292 RepID=UPI0011AEEB2E|nr:hypothetical protein [Dysgonomonas massiliensis]
MKEYNISEETISSIHKWTDEMDSSNMIGYMNLFYSIETAKEYKNCFFSHLDETLILGLYFPIRESQEFVDCFEPKGKNEGEIGLRYKLKQYQPDDDTGILLGFDLIGVEIGGEFHSFHCHDLANDLIERFDIAINEFGLIQNENKWEAIIDYMNDESNGFEPVPWFFVQVKLFN